MIPDAVTTYQHDWEYEHCNGQCGNCPNTACIRRREYDEPDPDCRKHWKADNEKARRICNG